MPECVVFAGPVWRLPEITGHWTIVDLMLAQSRRWWAKIKSTLAQCLVFAGLMHPSKHRMLNQRWDNVGPASQTFSVGQLLVISNILDDIYQIRHWALAYIKLNFTWNYQILSLGLVLLFKIRGPSGRLCYWTGWLMNVKYKLSL